MLSPCRNEHAERSRSARRDRHNLANANTPGFRRDLGMTSVRHPDDGELGDRHFRIDGLARCVGESLPGAARATVHEPGSLRLTGGHSTLPSRETDSSTPGTHGPGVLAGGQLLARRHGRMVGSGGLPVPEASRRDPDWALGRRASTSRVGSGRTTSAGSTVRGPADRRPGSLQRIGAGLWSAGGRWPGRILGGSR